MQTNRLEAFSDGVLAIIITIMVLELKTPGSDSWPALRELGPVLLSYLLSFVYVGIYWNNHHHLLHSVRRVSGDALWANLHLLFWLSFFPFVTAWMGNYPDSPLPTALYGGVLMMAALAWWILQARLIAGEAGRSLLARAVGRDAKGKASILVYALAILASIWSRPLAQLAYAGVAMLWLVPDRRIERVVGTDEA